MKRFFVSFIGIVSVVLFFSFCYYVSFRNSIKKLENEKIQRTNDMQDFLQEAEDSQKLMVHAETVSTEDSIITPDTVCVYEIVHLDTGETYQYEASPTSDLAGLNRTQLQNRLRQYFSDMSVMEFEAGLISYELISFSDARVVIQKVYDSDRIKYKYYVLGKNDEVIVYYSDKKTVFEYTGITRQVLSEDIWNALCVGIPVKDLDELYDYLSGITS